MNVISFTVEGFAGGSPVTLHPTLIRTRIKNYLIDCGYEETFDAFVDQLSQLTAAIDKLTAILVSHDDVDHLGTLRLFKDRNPPLLVYSSAIEAPSVAGDVKAERLIQVELSMSCLPDAHKAWAEQFIEAIRKSTLRFTSPARKR